jgi:uncharacterized membrane protein
VEEPQAGAAALVGALMGAGHSHGAGEEKLIDGWDRLSHDTTMRTTVFGVGIATMLTILGVILLWPTGEGRDEAIASGRQLGFVAERLSATVDDEVLTECSYSTPEDIQFCREITFIVNEGPEAGALVAIPPINARFDSSIPPLEAGDEVILGFEASTNHYFFADLDRRSSLVWLATIFAIFVIALSRIRGVLALVSMATTIVVLLGFVAPSVLDGNDPLLVCIVAAAAIAITSLSLTHGLSPSTTVALAGTLVALVLTLGLSYVFWELASITGLGTEEALLLPYLASELDLSKLLLGGAVIGTLGALDDITVTQAVTVAEMRRREPAAPTGSLIRSGIVVGREHIAATVNTLLLAYAGASMPLLLLFSVSDQPLDMVANAELIAVEIVRTLCGSIGLVAAVPVTTVLAAVATGGTASRDGPPEHAPIDDAPEPPAGEPDRALEPPRWEDFAPEGDEFD